MPLLVVTGYPSSGKSTISKIIKENFQKNSYINVVVVDDFMYEPNNTIKNFSKEKEHRNMLRSAVQKYLTKDCLVICDSLNYIKGFRYELYCICKQVGTTYALLYCKTSKECCERFNFKKCEELRYSNDLLCDLIKRYEEPNDKNRWDQPLFTICIETENLNISDDLNNTFLQEYLILPLKELYLCLIKNENLKSNITTLELIPKAPVDFLSELNRITQEIIFNLIEKQKNAIMGDYLVIFNDNTNKNKKIIFSKTRTLAELNRTRKQFMNYITTHSINNFDLIRSLFIDYLNSKLIYFV